MSEYAAGMPEKMINDRLFPVLPPEGMMAFCFYPMSKRRGDQHNWYALALSVRENEISDFPVNNKSFNLSYCGFDL